MIQISGEVIRGDGYGKVLGFPTANLDRREYVRKGMEVRLGVWAGVVELSLKSIDYRLKTWKAAIVIGPIDKKGLPKIEAHLIGFRGDLYGKRITIILQKYLRPFKKYDNIDDLKQQIRKDIIKVKNTLQ